MPPKEAVASAFHEADAEKKISLLKKAIVSLSKTKQDLETRNNQLEEKISSLLAEVAKLHEENGAMLRRARQAEEEAVSLKDKTSRAAQSFQNVPGMATAALKGWFTPFTGGTGGVKSAESQHDSSPRQPPVQSALSDPSKSTKRVLSPDEQEALFLENEKLHVELFELRAAMDSKRKACDLEVSAAKQEVAHLNEKLAAFAAERETTGSDLLGLKRRLREAEALASFCRTFLACAVEVHPSGKSCRVTLTPLLDHAQQTTLFDKHCDDANGKDLKIVMSSVSTLLLAISEKSPSVGVVGQAERSMLMTLLAAHRALKSEILDLSIPPKEHPTFSVDQLKLAEKFAEWLSIFSNHIPLLVELLVASAGVGSPAKGGMFVAPIEFDRETLALMLSDTPARLHEERVPRDVFCDRLAYHLTLALAALQGSTQAAISLAKQTARLTHIQDLPIWFPAMLQKLLWDGSLWDAQASASLQLSHRLLSFLARHAQSTAPIRLALEELASSLQQFASAPSPPRQRTNANPQSAFDALPFMCHPPLMEPPDDSLTKEELEAALRAADQRGVQYYVQLQSALVELSEKQQVILRTEEQLKQLREELQQKERENQSVAEAYESQIQLLSERLAELA